MESQLYKPTSLSDGFAKGYYAESINRDEFMDRITKHNPQLFWVATEDYRGLYDPLLKRKQFICGISHNYTVPKHDMMEYHADAIKKYNYTNEHGEIIETKEDYLRKESDKMLVRGWASVYSILERRGYKIDREGL